MAFVFAFDCRVVADRSLTIKWIGDGISESSELLLILRCVASTFALCEVALAKGRTELKEKGLLLAVEELPKARSSWM